MEHLGFPNRLMIPMNAKLVARDCHLHVHVHLGMNIFLFRDLHTRLPDARHIFLRSVFGCVKDSICFR